MLSERRSASRVSNEPLALPRHMLRPLDGAFPDLLLPGSHVQACAAFTMSGTLYFLPGPKTPDILQTNAPSTHTLVGLDGFPEFFCRKVGSTYS